MNEYVVGAIGFICMLGWIPILALGKAIAWIVEAAREKYDCTEENRNETEE